MIRAGILFWFKKLRLRHWLILWVFLFTGFGFLLILPNPLFDEPTSTVVYDRTGNLIGARIADDGQWRFSAEDSVSAKFKTCIIEFEDRYFRKHPGVNPFSLGRAVGLNIKNHKIVSGGSTLSMQVIRLARGNRPRNLWQKSIEIIMALRLELTRSKLPNAPSLIYPGKNRNELRQKRDRLLALLVKRNRIDTLNYTLSLAEEIPEKPFPLPDNASHFTAWMSGKRHGEVVKSTLDGPYQDAAQRIVNAHAARLSGNQIHNMAVLVLNNRTGEVLAYIGNTGGNIPEHSPMVDVIRQPRSSGSLLKPILYAALINSGEILPNALVPDIPVTIKNFTPKNFNQEYDGAVPAKEALVRSLNIPAVLMLRDFGLDRFYNLLKELRMPTLVFPANHYGLSLILGGAEITLWDICRIYSGWARTLIDSETHKNSPDYALREPIVELQSKPADLPRKQQGLVNLASIYLAFDAMRNVKRPESEAGWESYMSASPIAYKTGTSFGFRDAWSVGLTRDYLVGVWVGNADGEGRPGLMGAQVASPVMFDVFGVLPHGGWFEAPWEELTAIPVCSQSGMRSSPFCGEPDTVWAPAQCLETRVCPYHIQVNLDETERYRINSKCYPVSRMKTASWFVLPPTIARYYRARNPFYQALPPWMKGCQPSDQEVPFELIYPHPGDKIYVPLEGDSIRGKVILEATHRDPGSRLYWYLDEQYLGITSAIHKMTVQPQPGKHSLVLVDDLGYTLNCTFEVLAGV
ncbi:MAG: transglycosylase domain-containing protein [Bacteroidia bacterium]|nr:transglycosylase domain-containing protein [Bacteroidia bacterium]